MTPREFVERLGVYRGVLSRHKLKTLRGQALAGDVAGAQKGLAKLLREIRYDNHV